MTLLFVDGFDHYATADINKKWTSSQNLSINATSGRRGGGSCRFATGSVAYTQKTLAAGASWVIGVAFSITSLPSSACQIISLYDAGTLQCDLRVNADGTLSVTRNGTALTGGTSTNAIAAGAYNYIEWKVTISDSIVANSCKVRVNGVDWINVTTGQDTKNTANATATQVRIGTLISMGNTDFDDLYICDQSGSTNNDFLGDCRVDALTPTSDGTYTAFTPSTGTTHYTLVDESTPNTTDYNSSTTVVGDRDSYGFSDLTALTSQTVYGVQTNIAALNDDAGARSIGGFARSGTTNTDGTGVALGTSQVYVNNVFELDPNTSTAWTESTVNAAQFGVKVTA